MNIRIINSFLKLFAHFELWSSDTHSFYDKEDLFFFISCAVLSISGKLSTTHFLQAHAMKMW